MGKYIKKTFILILFFICFILSGCKTNTSNGKFLSIKEAYESKLIDKNDLLNIAYYYNNNENINEEFEFINQDDNELSSNIINMIKNAHLERIKNKTSNASIDGIIIKKFHGKYKDCYVVEITDSYIMVDVLIEPIYIIDGVKFQNFTFPGIEIWTNN